MRNSANQLPLNNFRLVALLGASAAVSIGVLGLSGLVLQLRSLTSFGENFIPIAFSTSTVFLIQGAILILHTLYPTDARRWALAGLIALTSIFGLLAFIGYFSNTDLNFERSMLPSGGQFAQFPVNRMSPITGFLSSLTGIALLKLLLYKNNKLAKHSVSTLAIVVSLTGLIGTIAYVYHSPLLYAGNVIPLALPTNAAFLFLGIGLLAAAGPETFPLKGLTGDSIRTMLLRAFMPLAFIAVICSDIFENLIASNDSALISAASAVFFATVAAVIAIQASRIIGGIIERAQAERARAEEALRRTEEKYRSIFENAEEGIYQSTLEGKFIEVNPAMAKIFGYASPEEMKNAINDIGRQLYVDPMRREAFIRVAEERGAAILEVQIIRKNGSAGWISDSMRIGRDRDGTYLEGIAEDITEHKRAEQEREELITQLQSALANVKLLSGFLPICASCKKIRNDEGFWQQIEAYIRDHSEAKFSHGICPDCAKKLYPELFDKKPELFDDMYPESSDK